MNSHGVEMRAVGSCQVRSLIEGQDNQNDIVFTGYAAVFNEWSNPLGKFRERIAPGAFAKAIQEDDVRALMNHDANYVLGRNRSGTLRLWEDDHGLGYEVQAPDAQWARDLRESVRRGDVSQCSFSFIAVRDEWSASQGVHERTLLEARLYDVSIVTYPAYPMTEASARSAENVLEQRCQVLADHARAANQMRRRRLDLCEKEQ